MKCRRCGKDALTGKTRCQKCHDDQLKYSRKSKQKALESGVCRSCCKNKAEAPFVVCESCRQKNQTKKYKPPFEMALKLERKAPAFMDTSVRIFPS